MPNAPEASPTDPTGPPPSGRMSPATFPILTDNDEGDPIWQAMKLVDADLLRYYEAMIDALEPQKPYLSDAEYNMYRHGKKIRPLMLLLSARLVFEGAADEPLARKAIFAAVSAEMLHVATLIHDDIVDRAPIRRGGESIHAARGTEMAILIGVLQFVQAIRCFANAIDAEEDMNLVRMVLNTAFKICCGEIDELQTDLTSHPRALRDRYMQTIERKTAVLFGLACECGAALGGGRDRDARANQFLWPTRRPSISDHGRHLRRGQVGPGRRQGARHGSRPATRVAADHLCHGRVGTGPRREPDYAGRNFRSGGSQAGVAGDSTIGRFLQGLSRRSTGDYGFPRLSVDLSSERLPRCPGGRRIPRCQSALHLVTGRLFKFGKELDMSDTRGTLEYLVASLVTLANDPDYRKFYFPNFLPTIQNGKYVPYRTDLNLGEVESLKKFASDDVCQGGWGVTHGIAAIATAPPVMDLTSVTLNGLNNLKIVSCSVGAPNESQQYPVGFAAQLNAYPSLPNLTVNPGTSPFRVIVAQRRIGKPATANWRKASPRTARFRPTSMAPCSTSPCCSP